MRKFVLTLLAVGTPCLVIGEVLSLGKGDTLGSIGFLITIVAVFVPAVRSLFRFLHRCYREIMNCIWVVRRGVLNPIQVRQEFIDTMGREPTIAEVHDLQAIVRDF